MKKAICIALLLLLAFSAAVPAMAGNGLRKGVGKDIPVYNQGLESLRNAGVQDRVAAVAAQCRAAGKTGDVEIAMWLHDWLTHNANYDYTYTYYGADGVLSQGTGVCQSYTLAYGLLLDEFGIENVRVVSDAMNHTWSMIKLNGVWYHVDVTWDDPDTGGYENQTYFGLSDASIGRDHSWEWIVKKDGSYVPAAEAGYTCPQDLELGGVALPQPVAVTTGRTPAALELVAVGGGRYTMESFTGTRTLFVLGRMGCGNTQYFLSEISKYASIISGARVVVGLIEDPTDAEINAFAANYSSQFLYTRITDGSDLFRALSSAGVSHDGSITLPVVVMKDVDDNYVYGSEGYIAKPTSVLAALLALPQTSTYTCKDVEGGVEITRYTGFASNVAIPESIHGKKVVALGDGLFMNNGVIASVTMPDTLERIGANAFAGSALKTATLSRGLKSIGASAFKGTALTQVFLSDVLTQIGAGAFEGVPLDTVQTLEGCYADTYIKQNFPNVKRSYLDTADYYLTFRQTADHYVVSKVKGSPVHVDVPATWNDLPVTEIANGAFYACASLKTITLPSSLRLIDVAAFRGCAGLEAVDIPEGVVQIGNSAFAECGALKRLTLPSTLTNLGNYAFGSCDALPSVNLPENLAVCGDTPFSYNTKAFCRIGTKTAEVLRNSFYDPSAPSLRLRRNDSGLLMVSDYDGTEAGARVVIPQGVQTVSSFAFSSYSGVAAIVMPESVTVLDRGVLAYTAIKEITMPYALARTLAVEADGWQKDIVAYLMYDDGLTDVEKLVLTRNGLEVASWTDPGVVAVPLTADMVTLSKTSWPYTGARIMPTVTVARDGITYVENKDYLVSYGENVEPGKGAVVVLGQKRLSGSVTVSFDITPMRLSEATMTLSATEVEYRGVPATVDVKLTYGGAVLTANKDYTLAFRDNTDVGTALVEATGVGHFTGKATGYFSIRYGNIPSVDAARTLTLPKTLERVAAEAFMKTAAEAVSMKSCSACKSIGARAFAGCATLKLVYIPAAVEAIDDTAFAGCGDGLTLALQRSSPLLVKRNGVSWADKWMRDGKGHVAVWG